MGSKRKKHAFSNLFAIACLLSIGVHIKEVHAFKFSEQMCREYGLGPNWYCEHEPDKPKALPTLEDVMKRNVLPEEKAALLNQLWETQQKRAVITGRKEDLEQVLLTQRYIAQLGTDFAKNMTRLIETHPEYFQNDNYFANISKEYVEDSRRTAALSQARERYAIAFIYTSSCPYCERQLPILESLKSTYGISLIGISADGGFYQGLDQNIADASVMNDQNIRAFPTIMLLDAKTTKRIFISKGLTTRDNLESLIYKAIKETEAMEEIESTTKIEPRKTNSNKDKIRNNQENPEVLHAKTH